jgi:hypothetical protein
MRRLREALRRKAEQNWLRPPGEVEHTGPDGMTEGARELLRAAESRANGQRKARSPAPVGASLPKVGAK